MEILKGGHAMKTRARFLFAIISLFAAPAFAADFKKGVGSGWFGCKGNTDKTGEQMCSVITTTPPVINRGCLLQRYPP
jgi:hypothetical protein